jgi:hypothetical protein
MHLIGDTFRKMIHHVQAMPLQDEMPCHFVRNRSSIFEHP